MTVPLVLAAIGCSNDIQVADKNNTAPAAVIQSPASGTAFTASEVVEFVGQVTDSNGLDDIVTVFWNSSVDGEIADIDSATPDADGLSRLALILSPGNHAITLTATDSAGATAEDSINISVGEAQQSPIVSIDDPTNFAQFYPGADVDLLGSVDDGQQAANTLDVVWTIVDNATQATVDTLPAPATPNGITSTTWVAGAQGNYKIQLTATDDDGNATMEEVLVVVEDPDFADLDGDGFAPATGDCDDGDPYVNPNADETCGDLIDNDCNGTVDDKDLDNDGHIDEACVNYPGPDPIDDCDDNDALTHGGAYELQDGIDNDCDGEIDNGGPAYDDDGDCYCETGPCVGSVDPTCLPYLTDGDCDDDDVYRSPMSVDDPDMGYVDDNCDGIDGDELNSVFIDPIGGADANSGLDRASPKRTLTAALQTATANGRDWVLVSYGTIGFTGASDQFLEGVNMAGGYDAGTGWTRSSVTMPDISLPAGGERLTGWSIPTEWQQLRFVAANATGSSATSIALWLDQSVGLTLTECEVQAGNGTAGNSGAAGSAGGSGSSGGRGGDGCQDSSFLCNSCSRPSGGSGGGACSGSGSGGAGGRPGHGGSAGDYGSSGNGTGGGAAGAGGNNNGDPGNAGLDGADGTEGSAGAAGGSIGSFHLTLGYIPSDGGDGGNGTAGAGGGGGGGGAGGGWTTLNCDTYGGAGGGGGGGGCGGTGATGGYGGGASVGIVLTQGSGIVLNGGSVATGSGGRGGDGGGGGNGGSGGTGGNGGNGESSVISETSGPGGRGGDGGNGGRGGHGGGGGGGPSIGVLCRDGSSATASGVSYAIGSAGNGGGGPGAAGASGLAVDTDGC